MMMPAEPLPTIYVFVVGLIFGSFLNVCIYRLPRGLNIVRPRSACPSCGKEIPAWLNVPVLSWLILRGKCRECRTSISIRYPLVELMTGVGVTVLWRIYGFSPEFPFVAVFFMAMLVLFFTDFDLQLLPDAITLTGFLAALTLAWWNPFLPGEGWARVWMSLVGAALGSGVLWSLGAFYSRLRGVEAMGFGDVKMMAFVGAMVGWKGVLFTLFAGSVVGAAFGLAMIPLRGRTMQDTLPFRCFLAPASLISLMYGQQALAAYLGMFSIAAGP